jgi:hypothetical protein
MRILIPFLMLASAGASGAINLTWDPVPAATGYYVYCEPQPLSGGPYTPGQSVITEFADVEAQIPALETRECWVTAYDATSESADSNHLVITNPGPFQVIETLSPPGNMSWEIQRVVE